VHIFLPLQVTVSAVYVAVDGHPPLSLSFKISLHACELLSEQHLLHDPCLQVALSTFVADVNGNSPSGSSENVDKLSEIR